MQLMNPRMALTDSEQAACNRATESIGSWKVFRSPVVQKDSFWESR